MSNRIHTTHVGSLPRPRPLLELMRKRARGENVVEETLQTLLRESVHDAVARQAAAGIDYVSDGELSKPSYATYISARLSGFGQYARVVGRERVMAGSDCGFSTFSCFPTVYPDIVWKKMQAMVEGARLASKALWT
jgi:methionine synthase II (cobalamin-independent)